MEDKKKSAEKYFSAKFPNKYYTVILRLNALEEYYAEMVHTVAGETLERLVVALGKIEKTENNWKADCIQNEEQSLINSSLTHDERVLISGPMPESEKYTSGFHTIESIEIYERIYPIWKY